MTSRKNRAAGRDANNDEKKTKNITFLTSELKPKIASSPENKRANNKKTEIDNRAFWVSFSKISFLVTSDILLIKLLYVISKLLILQMFGGFEPLEGF